MSTDMLGFFVCAQFGKLPAISRFEPEIAQKLKWISVVSVLKIDGIEKKGPGELPLAEAGKESIDDIETSRSHDTRAPRFRPARAARVELGSFRRNFNSKRKRRSTMNREQTDREKLAAAAIDRAIEAVDALVRRVTAFRFQFGEPSEEDDDESEFFGIAKGLLPEIEIARERADGRLKLALARVPREQEDWWEIHEIDTDLNRVTYGGIRAGFWLGQLFGARMAGTSDDKMRELAAGLLHRIKTNPVELEDFKELMGQQNTAEGAPATN